MKLFAWLTAAKGGSRLDSHEDSGSGNPPAATHRRHCTRSWRASLAAIAIGVLAIAQPTGASAATLSSDLNQILSLKLLSRVHIIVQTNGAPSSGLLSLIQLLGGKIYAQFSSINGVAVDSPLSLITTLLTQPSVTHISPDRQTKGSLDLSSAAAGSTAARNATGLSGRGIGGAVLDTGGPPH